MRARPVDIRRFASAPRPVEEAFVKRTCRVRLAFEIAQANGGFIIRDRQLLCCGQVAFDGSLCGGSALVIAPKTVGDALRFRVHRLLRIGEHGLRFLHGGMQVPKITRKIGELALRFGDAAAQCRNRAEIEPFGERAEIAPLPQRLLYLLAARFGIFGAHTRQSELLIDIAQLLIGNQLLARADEPVLCLEFLDLPFGIEKLMPQSFEPGGEDGACIARRLRRADCA
jgi:hypothetical protein